MAHFVGEAGLTVGAEVILDGASADKRLERSQAGL